MLYTLEVLVLWGLFILGSLFFLNYFAGESKARTFGIFSLFLAILSVVYFPCITGHYIFHDDVYLWAWQKTIWATHAQYSGDGLCFRPLSRIIRFSLGNFVDHVNDANYIRFVTIIITSLTAMAIDIWLRKVCAFSRGPSCLISLAIVVLPPFQIYVSWMSAGPLAVAIFLTLCSALMLLDPAQKGPSQLMFLTVPLLIKDRKKFLKVLISSILLFCSLLIYQPVGTFYIALLAVWLIGENCQEMNFKKWPWLHLAVFFMTAFIDILLYKMLIPANAMGTGSIYNNSFTTDYAGKLWWFFQEPMVAALNLWHVFPSRAVAGAVLFIILWGVLLEFFDPRETKDNNRGGFPWNIALKYFGVICLIFLSFSVNFIAQTNYFFYRTIAPLITIVFFLFWSGARRILAFYFKKERYEAFSRSILFLICVSGMFCAYRASKMYCVDNNTREMRYIENELAKKYNPNIWEILIIRPSGPPSPQVAIQDEFGYTSCFFPSNVFCMIEAAAKEQGIILHKGLLLSSGTSTDHFPQDPGFLIIDLNRSG